MSLNNTCDIFEGHFPFIKKTHVILEYGKPIYPKELDKDEKIFFDLPANGTDEQADVKKVEFDFECLQKID